VGDLGTQLTGTLVGRWYVTIFGITFVVLAVRHMGWRRTLLYAVVAVTVGGLAENASVHLGVPYTRYAFNPELRGEELHLGSVPLMVSLSYTFMAYFAFGASRLVVGGPHRSRSRTPVLEYLVAVVLAVWIIWVIDPVSRLGEHFFLGRLFAYDGPGFWFGLPLGSQIGFALTQGVLIGFLTWLMRDEPTERVASVWRHPRIGALGGIVGQLVFMSVTVFWVARTVGDPEVTATADALAGSAAIIAVPVVLMTAVHWRYLTLAERFEGSTEQADRLELDERVEPLRSVLPTESARLEPSER